MWKKGGKAQAQLNKVASKANDATPRTSDDVERVALHALPPPLWPSQVFFLASHSQPSPLLAAEHQLQLCVAPRLTHKAHPFRVRACGWTVVRSITDATPFQSAFGSTSKQHPARGQCGLFARKDIPPRTLVVPYMGLVHVAGDAAGDEDSESSYDAAIEADDGTRLGVDATSMGCEARFVNDYRGILPRPNLFFDQWSAATPREVLCLRSRAGEETACLPNRVRGLALYSGAHPIRAGIELCVSYGKGWWAARQADTGEEE